VEIHTFSGNKPESIAGEAPAFIFVCEAARTTPRVLEVVMERTGPNKAIAVFSGTFERDVQTWYHQMYWELIEGGNPEAIAFSLPSWANRSRYPGGRNDPEILRQERLHNADFFQERFAGVPVKPRGIVIPEFSGRYHVKDAAEFDPELGTTYVFQDPGYGSTHENVHSLLFVQQDPLTLQLRVFDEIYRLERTTEMMIDEMTMRWWWKRAREDWALAGDGWYVNNHYSVASVADVWREKTGKRIRATKVKPKEGIDLMRHYFKVDPALPARIIINPRCRGLLSELGYCPSPALHRMAAWAYNIGPDGHATSTEPMNHHNHSCTALYTGIKTYFGNPFRGMEAQVGPKVYRLVHGRYVAVGKGEE